MIKAALTLPTPINISYMWNFGSLLGLFLVIQIFSGFFLSLHYCPNLNEAFSSIIHIIQNVNYGWIFHNIHMNGASFFFILIYLHISRGLYYHSFKLKNTWISGTSILLVAMMTAFLGYVLPWGQMSFWGATVITNLISTIPWMGPSIVQWVWGGFSINNATLNRFFSMHFIMPFLILLLVIIHLYFLHSLGSSNPLGMNSDLSKIPFHYYYLIKDILGFNIIFIIFIIFIFQYPYSLSDPDNFTPANPMVTPTHIKPEWYFLFAYTILRAIPNKLGGVIALILSISILYFLPFMNKSIMNTTQFYTPTQILFWLFINTFIILTWLGAQLIEPPYMFLSQFFAFIYFSSIMGMMATNKMWDFILYYDY
uniref:cytochrome b n=1 Tax=Harpegnathos venator TaxID=610381 RepID=UPI002A80A925|nr:cytochrome b [Harpegnathos venator]WON66587.1 cytochrome b [Harpegnathos venator]